MYRLLSSSLAGSLTICACAAGLIMSTAPGASATVRPAGEPSTNWSGYVDTNSGGHTYSEVSGNWTEPTATCTSTNSDAAFWVGLDGFTSATVEQAGTLAVCGDGTASYYTWWEMYPTDALQIVGETVNPATRSPIR